VIPILACWWKMCGITSWDVCFLHIWNRGVKELFLARDHFGIPNHLVYSESNRGFAFASGIPSLQIFDFVDFDLDFQSITAISFISVYFPLQRQFYKGIKKT